MCGAWVEIDQRLPRARLLYIASLVARGGKNKVESRAKTIGTMNGRQTGHCNTRAKAVKSLAKTKIRAPAAAESTDALPQGASLCIIIHLECVVSMVLQ
jgi:hypothetical protein